LDEAEKLTGQARQDALSKLATQIDNDVAGAADQAKVRSVASSVRDLAASQSASR
jgi:hypothetical protein